MAIVKCIECGGDVSFNAKACPHCGTTKFRKNTWAEYIVSGFLLISVFLTSIFAFHSCTTDDDGNPINYSQKIERDTSIYSVGVQGG